MRCKSCGADKGEDAFYSSNKTKCKECVKESVRSNRIANIEHYRSFDRLRGSQPHRVKARLAYQETDAFRESHNKANQKYLIAQPKRAFARTAVGNAVRDGKLFKLPCMVCGAEKVEGHHADYDRPLDVVWLCSAHHKQAHALVKPRNCKEAT